MSVQFILAIFDCFDKNIEFLIKIKTSGNYLLMHTTRIGQTDS